MDNFSCLNGDIWNLFLQKYSLSSPLRFICPNYLIYWVARATKRVNFRNNVETSLLMNHKVDQAGTFHACL